jgi:hypothetical protein
LQGSDPQRPSERPHKLTDEEQDTYEGWEKFNRHYWRRDYEGFLDFFSRIFTVPHSTKQIEDGIGWGLETDGETLVRTADAETTVVDQPAMHALCRSISAPLLVIHGVEDSIIAHARSETIAELTGASMVTVAGGGHNQALQRGDDRARRPVRRHPGRPSTWLIASNALWPRATPAWKGSCHEACDVLPALPRRLWAAPGHRRRTGQRCGRRP